MRRRTLIAAIGWSILGSFPGSELYAADRLDAATIKAGLRTTTREEEGFVGRAVALVDQGVLPEKLVEGVFNWARRKERHRFQYFKRALTIQAAKIGVRL